MYVRKKFNKFTFWFLFNYFYLKSRSEPDMTASKLELFFLQKLLFSQPGEVISKLILLKLETGHEEADVFGAMH
jgi:hypothetical protein